MKKLTLLALCAFAFLNSQAQVDKSKMRSDIGVTKLNSAFQDSIRLKKFAPSTIGYALQEGKIDMSKLTDDEKKQLQSMSLMKYPNSFNVSYPLSSKFKCLLFPETCSSININNFKGLHPCGVAISKTGKVAITTFEGDKNDGAILIWTNYNDFKSGKNANYQYSLKDPEAIVFDNNEGLYISNTYEGKIYYMKSITDNPNSRFMVAGTSYFIDKATNSSSAVNWNPRGLAVNAQNELFVMCENLQREKLESKILKISNANTNNPQISELKGYKLDSNNAIGIFLNGNTLYATELKRGFVNQYNLSGNNLTQLKQLPDAGAPLDVIAEGQVVYFTNVSYDNNDKTLQKNQKGDMEMLPSPHSYVVKWDSQSNATTNVDMGRLLVPNDYITTSWGLAIYGNDLIIADAIHNSVKIKSKTSF